MAEVQSMEQATCRRLELRKLCPPMAPRREGPRNTNSQRVLTEPFCVYTKRATGNRRGNRERPGLLILKTMSPYVAQASLKIAFLLSLL